MSRPLLLVAVLGAGLFHAEATRQVGKPSRGPKAAAKLAGGPRPEAEARGPKAGDGIVVDKTGGITLADGTKLPPFSGMKVEAHLTHRSFKCANGRLMGVRLPGRSRAKDSLFHVRSSPAPQFRPLQIYIDLSDETSQFLLFPPVKGLSVEWRLLYSRAKKAGDSTDWAEQRFFRIGYGAHPCEADAEEAERERAVKAAVAFEPEEAAAPAPEAAAAAAEGDVAAKASTGQAPAHAAVAQHAVGGGTAAAAVREEAGSAKDESTEEESAEEEEETSEGESDEEEESLGSSGEDTEYEDSADAEAEPEEAAGEQRSDAGGAAGAAGGGDAAPAGAGAGTSEVPAAAPGAPRAEGGVVRRLTKALWGMVFRSEAGEGGGR